MKKGGFLRNVLDTIRSNQASGQSGRGGQGGAGERGVEFGGQLKPSHFALRQVARHGFPEHPTALAFDPVQKIAAVGTKSGALRIFGRPGAEVWAQHEPAYAVTHVRFVVNQGAIITVTADETIHLWSLRGPNLKLQFSTGGQGASGSSPQASSPAPTPASGLSSVSPQSGGSFNAPSASTVSAATSPSSFLGSITDTVSGAVDSTSDYLNTGLLTDDLTTPSLQADRQSFNKRPEILHNLKFQREHITCIHQTLTSKWLYIGTDRGNVHVANIETFELSGYSIAWNKAIELSRKAHPGAIIHLSECPQDTNKLLIGYESGCIVLWDLKQRNADGRYHHTDHLLWLDWHYEGKQFVAAHGDGSLITWQTRSNTRPASIIHPHAKMAAGGGGQQQQQFTDPTTGQAQAASLASSLVRSLNNELYRPINKVEWKTAKSNNEQFYLFSGGLPYDGFDQAPAPQESNIKPPSRQSATSQPQQYLQASSGGTLASPSPISPSVSPNPQDPYSSGGGSKTPNLSEQRHLNQREKKSLRSTSLTVMYGKSITVLEMDDTIIDFITICDNSPYENDTSEPYAVIVLLSNELILIDLTSSGYPSFDTPYPASSLNESPVTCVQYLADCSSDLIPFLYSTSQNVISRAPKKGYSDKEWPINGGEWGQSMQSYPELVLTGHADGTIKFWDMSGVNFDLISKIKTSKLFERPNKPPNAVLISTTSGGGSGRGGGASKRAQGVSDPDQLSSRATNDLLDTNQTTFDESLFAIEKIEFCSTTKRLLVAGACSQVIQFKLNKKEAHSSGSASSELATILVEPNADALGPTTTNQAQWRCHQLFQVKGPQGSGGGSSSSGGSSSGSNRGRGLSGFITEIVCLTPLLVSTQPPIDEYTIIASTELEQSSGAAASASIPYYCQVPPKITALAFQPTHNILAYAHKNGIVLVDIIQKCIIINATLSDLYGGGSSMAAASRDISIQPYATSSILQHHYQATSAASAVFANSSASADFGGASEHVGGKYADNGHAAGHNQQTDFGDNDRTMESVSSKPDGGQICASTRTVPNQVTGTTRQAANAVFELAGGLVSASQAQKQQQQQKLLAAPNQVGQLSTSSSYNQLLSGPSSSSPPPLTGASMGGNLDATRRRYQISTPSIEQPLEAARNNEQNNENGNLQIAPTSAASSPTRNQQKPAVQSRYTNSMFQRQLSTNALTTGPSAQTGSCSSTGATTPSKAGSAVAHGPRLFQRQMTASQLFGASSSTSGAASTAAGQLDKKRLLTSARADLDLARSAANLTTAALAAQQASGGGGQRAASARLDESSAKKPAKNKRIISRMLSISAIHTSVGSNHSPSSATTAATTTTNNGEIGGNHHHHHHHETGYQSDEPGSLGAMAEPPRNTDKFDSSFRRSRSSSTSSTAGQQQQAATAAASNASESHATASAACESIQCIAFVDAAQAGGALASGGTPTGSAPSSSLGTVATGSSSSAQTATGQVQSSAGGGGGANHKSLSPIDTSQQLALWLGTSTGSVLLLNLQMPDTEDNRVLQLQSINAKPIPQASVKLSGQILCLATFTCEARAQLAAGGGGQQSTGASGASSGLGSMATASGITSGAQGGGAASQSSSLEGDTLIQSPGSSNSSSSPGSNAAGATSGGNTGGGGGSSSSGSGGGGAAAPSGGRSFHGDSLDARSSLFLAVISEKQARIYQVPPMLQSPMQQQTTVSGHQSSSSTSGGAGGSDFSASSLASLMSNKRNLIAECDLSESSFACRSQVVQMRTPDESCLVSYLANGNLVVHALPRLRPVLLDADFVPFTHSRIATSMQLARNGHALYQPSPGELCKFTICAQYKAMVNDMLGLVYVPREMPEMPRTNFFKSLFSGSQSAKQSDRDELFGECSAGRSTRGVAKHLGASSSGGGNLPSGMDKLKSAAVGTMGYEMRVAREGLDERGEKLSEIEDRTLNMMNSAEGYSQAAQQLAQKFKDKKWYQF